MTESDLSLKKIQKDTKLLLVKRLSVLSMCGWFGLNISHGCRSFHSPASSAFQVRSIKTTTLRKQWFRAECQWRNQLEMLL